MVMPFNPDEVFEMAIGVERDSIDLYAGMKELVSRKADKDKV